MARHDEITSTEKLLDLIRNDETASDKTIDVSGTTPSTKERKPISKKIIPSQKAITVGVDISYHDVRMAKVTRSSDKKWKFLGYMKVPFEPQITKDSPEFPDFLRSTLIKFCGSSKKIKLWTLMPSAQVEVHHFRIPRVTKKQIANAVYWTLKKETSFEENNTILDFEVQGDVMEKGIHKTAVMAYATPKEEVEKIKNIFSKTGFHLTGLSIDQFAYQNLLRTKWIPTFEETIASLYIGKDRSRIDIFSSGNLVFTRSIKTGMNSMIESLMESFKERKDEEIPIEMSDEEKISLSRNSEQESSMNMDQARKLILSLSPGSPPLTETDPGFHLKEDIIFEVILPSVERLIRQIERTFEHYSGTTGGERAKKIFVSGGINGYKPLIDYIGDQLGIERDIFDPLGPENPFLDDILPPDSVTERISCTPAVGMALSDSSYTPNIIFTYKDKEESTSIRRINRGIFVAFMFIMAVCMCIFLWQGHSAALKKAKITQIRKELLPYSPRVDQKLLMLMSSKDKRKQKYLKEYSNKYLAMAVISDISMRTPSNIRLLSITANFGGIADDKSKTTPKTLEVDGMILGDSETLESSLAGYLMKLEGSPIFSQLSIVKSDMEPYEEREVLHFVLNIQLV